MKIRKLLILFFVIFFSWNYIGFAESVHQKQHIFDHAKLLTDKEVAKLEALAKDLGAKRETAFIIITLNGIDGKDIVQYVGDYYDDEAPGYDKPHGNTAILSIDMKERDVYLAGFQKAETYLDDERLDQIRNKITPHLSDGNFYDAFSLFITTSHDYMGYEPGVNPENILFKLWFQLAVAVGAAAVIVTMMAYRSGGRVTVNARTYIDNNRSMIVSKHDNYIRTTVTKVRKPSNNNKGGGGGGGFTGGGFSHSGSRGKF